MALRGLKSFKPLLSIAQQTVLFLRVIAFVTIGAFFAGELDIDRDTLLSCLICILTVALAVVVYRLRDAINAPEQPESYRDED